MARVSAVSDDELAERGRGTPGQRVPAGAGRRPRRRRPVAGRLPVPRRPARPPRRARTRRPRRQPVAAVAGVSVVPGRPLRTRNASTCTASARSAIPGRAAWSATRTGPQDWHPMRADAGPAPDVRGDRPLPVPHRRRHRGVRDPGRTGARRPHRTRPLPVLRRRRNRPAAQGPAVVRAPRHRETLRRPPRHRRGRPRRTDQRRHLRRSRPRAQPGRRGRPRHRRARRRAPAAGPAGRTRTALQPRRRPRRARQRRRLRPGQRARPTHPRTTPADQRTPSPGTGCCAAPSARAASRCETLPDPARAAVDRRRPRRGRRTDPGQHASSTTGSPAPPS